MKKGFAPILIILTLIVAIAVGLVGLKFYVNSHNTLTRENIIPPTQDQATSPKLSPKKSPSDETTNPDSIGANWKTYTNAKFRFSIQYPKDWLLIDTGYITGSGDHSAKLSSQFVNLKSTKDSDASEGGPNVGIGICEGGCGGGPIEGGKILSTEKIKIKDTELTKRKISGGYNSNITEVIDINYSYNLDGKSFVISLNGWANNGSEKLIDQILATFRFI